MEEKQCYVVVYTGLETLQLCTRLRSVEKIYLVVLDCLFLTNQDRDCIKEIKKECHCEVKEFEIAKNENQKDIEVTFTIELSNSFNALFEFCGEKLTLSDDLEIPLNFARLITAIDLARKKSIKEIYWCTNSKPTEELEGICSKISKEFNISVYTIHF